MAFAPGVLPHGVLSLLFSHAIPVQSIFRNPRIKLIGFDRILDLVVFIAQPTAAATIYLRDKTRIENVRIVKETPSDFHIRKADGNQSFVYSYDVIKKGDIFCLIDDKGEIRYPAVLTMTPAPDGASAKDSTKELSQQELQMLVLQQEYEAQKEANAGLKGLGIVALLSAPAAINSSIALMNNWWGL